jgi:hypothetical protein
MNGAPTGQDSPVASIATTAAGAGGAALLLLALIDLFIAIFNYDGFTFLSERLHHLTWRALRRTSALLPERARHGYLSLGSAGMLPLTLAWWLALEITAFALLYLPGLGGDGFARGTGDAGIAAAFYLSGGAISSLTFGDITPRSGLDRALVDLETIVGLTTFTLGLTYVLTAFDTLSGLNRLHGRVRRHAIDPNQPSSIIRRYYHGGQASELSEVLSAFSEDLETYDQGLRRYPVVFYFHTRRPEHSIPTVFNALGTVIELLRWGLPSDDPMREEPHLLALAEQFTTTVNRLQRSFVGPDTLSPPDPLPPKEFDARYAGPATVDDHYVSAFRHLRREAAAACGRADDASDRYPSYLEWLPFHHRHRVFLDRAADVLGYER